MAKMSGPWFHRLHAILAATICLAAGNFVLGDEHWPAASNPFSAGAPPLTSDFRAVQYIEGQPQLASRQLPGPQLNDPYLAPYGGSGPLLDPYGAPALGALPYVPLSLSRAYVYDSFEGQLSELQRSPDTFRCAWLTTPTNGHLTWIQGQGDSLGFTEFDRRILIANPLIEPLRIIPAFATRYVSGPTTTDLPAQLFDLSLEFAATYQLEDEWTVDVGIKPGLYGDYRFLNYDTFRLGGHAVFSRPISPTTQGVLGFVYLSREDIPALPVAGFVWQPSADIKWELVFPRPRVAVRVGNGSSDNGWLYLRGEMGGNSWSIQRANDHRDVATYRDLRLILGYETLVTSGLAVNLETGWVFSRKLMYESATPDFTPNDTFLIRVGLSY